MMDLTHILDDCLRRLASGQGRAEILARYPEQADRLAPMLDAAARLTTLSAARLSDPQKLRAKVALRQAVAERGMSRPRAIWPRLRALPVALSLAAVLLIALSVSAVAASKPGDMAYPLRIAVERAPTLVQLTPSGRAAAELDIADRRMADLGGYFASTGQADPFALDALLAGDEAAAGRAARLSDDRRTGVAARIMAHADALETLAGAGAAPADALRLRAAAERSRQIANDLSQNSPAPVVPPTASPPTPGDAGIAPSEPTATPTPTSLRPTDGPPTHVPPTGEPKEAATPTSAPTSAPTDTVLPARTPRPQPRLTAIAPPPAIVTRLPGQHPLPTHTPDPGATATATASLATRVRPTNIVTPLPALIPPRPTRAPWRPAVTPLPTRTPGSPLLTPRPTRTPLPPGTATRIRPWPPRGTPIPTDAPTVVPADTATPAPAETPAITSAETPTPDTAGAAATQTPLPEPGATPPGIGPQAPERQPVGGRRP